MSSKTSGKQSEWISRKVFDAMREDRDYWRQRASQEKRERERLEVMLVDERKLAALAQQRAIRSANAWFTGGKTTQ